MGERLYFVQWLRVFLITMVVGHHAVEPYVAAGGEWRDIVPDEARSEVLLYFFLLNRTYFMGFFFLIAGYFLEASFVRHGAWGLVRSRLLRLGVPLLVIVLLVNGFVGYMIYGEDISFLGFVFGPYLMGGNAEFGPQWFIAHLLFYALVFAVVRGSGLISVPVLSAPGHKSIFAFALGLGLATAALRPIFPIDDWVRAFGLVPVEPGRLPQYISLFMIGIIAGRGQWFTKIEARTGAVWGGIGIAFFALGAVFLPQSALWPSGPLSVVWGLLEGFIGTGMILGLLVLFRQGLTETGPWLKRLEVNVYGAYLIHLYPILALQVVVLGFDWPAAAKVAVVWPGALIISFGLTALLRLIPPVRRVI